MQKLSIAAVLGGLFLMPLAGTMGAMGQSTNVASAPNPPVGYMVFLDNGSRLSPVAMDTVRSAAAAAKSGRMIGVEGRAEHADIVKKELVRQGAPAESIAVRPASRPLKKAADGVNDPTDRRVEIKF